MVNYHKDGFREAVLFLFYKDGKILIEHRPKKDGTKEIFIPNGGIDTKDINKKEDYRLVAMRREIDEEFSGAINIKNFLPLGIFVVEEIKIKFFGYLVTKWNGEVPAFTVEDNKKFADLEWIDIRKYKDFLTFPSAKFFVKKSIDILNDQNYRKV